MQVIYAPVVFYCFWLAIKARAWGFFSATNPGITFGGLLGDSKIDILRKLPREYIPNTVFIPVSTPLDIVYSKMAGAGLEFPIIAKPDIGERGFLVEKINDRDALREYIQKHNLDIILQEFITYPEEVGILYYRFPGSRRGHISSLTLKQFLSVTGDGQSTIGELIKSSPRAKLQYYTLMKRHPQWNYTILDQGVTMQLVPIGNHCRGTMFLNGSQHIDDQLIDMFDQICDQTEGMYFGRFDIKCNSLEELKQGVNFSILEFNGVKSEPTHIYHPGYSLWKAYKELFQQWKVIYKISEINHKRGVPFASLKDILKAFVAHNKYKKQADLAEVELATSSQTRG